MLAAGRRASAPAAALDVDGEGPALDRPTPLAGWFPDAPDTALAVFTAPGCGLCRRVMPAAEALAARGVTVRRFDAEQDAAAWAAAGVPGAPYAVAVCADGRVLAKGTVNDGRQLESVLAAAPRAARRGSARRAPRLFAARRGGRARSSRRALLARAGAFAGAGVLGSVVAPRRAPRPTTSAATSTRPTAARTRRACRGSTAAGCRCARADGRQVDDLGRLIDRNGNPVDEDGAPLTDLEGRPLPAAPRTPVCRLTGLTRGITVRTDGAWYRCCGGRVRKLVDCCSPNRTRINGDRALKGYCYDGRKVYCVMYFQSSVPC